MLHIFTGDDFATIQKKKSALLSSLYTKRPSAQIINLKSDHPEVLPVLQEHTASVGLFDSKSIICANSLCAENEIKQYLLSNAPLFHESKNAFILYEQLLSKKEITSFTKHGAIVYEHNAHKQVKDNLFYLADLLCAKNTRALWTALQKEFLNGVAPEAIYGILVFQARSLHLAKTKNRADSGLSDFVYNKAHKSSWSATQAQSLHIRLVSQYHESRRGGLDLSCRLEQIILSLPQS
ncbi:MAG: hypothetical protein ACKKL4_02650 [Patescibacteria group bacterium]